MTSRKAYCKQLNPHSFIKKSNKQTPKKRQKKKKGMFSDVELAEGDFVRPLLDLREN